MEGMVLGIDAEGGVIRTADGTRYRFGRSDWKSPRAPQAKDRVDFVVDGEHAREIYLIGYGMGDIAEAFDKVQASEKTMPAVVYGCYIGAILWGVTMIVGVVIAYVYRGSASPALPRTHFDYQISIFWKSLIGYLLGILLLFFGVGAVILVLTYLWVILKSIKGWRLLNQDQPMPSRN
ncbi:DUF4870 family protein [Geomonas oryzae]|uniref:DUF4870 family protein n=1 Tax=Geomonas oryzae TaxID=2364273 RepID=UPI00100B250B|nr:hypothetical protein [Geomonas oryzae]